MFASFVSVCFTFSSTWISFFSDVKTSNVLLWFCLYCSSIYFLVMRTVCHVSKCSSNLRKIDLLQFLSTQVQGMYTPVRLMHFFSCVKKFLMRLWNCTYRLEFGFGRRDAVIQPLGAKNEKSSTIYAKGWKQMDVIFAILRIERLWWPGNVI